MTQVRRPVYPGLCGNWKHYETALEPLFAALVDDDLTSTAQQ